MTEYKSIHANVPLGDYNDLHDIVARGQYINVSDAVRRYIRDGIRKDKE